MSVLGYVSQYGGRGRKTFHPVTLDVSQNRVFAFHNFRFFVISGKNQFFTHRVPLNSKFVGSLVKYFVILHVSILQFREHF